MRDKHIAGLFAQAAADPYYRARRRALAYDAVLSLRAMIPTEDHASALIALSIRRCFDLADLRHAYRQIEAKEAWDRAQGPKIKVWSRS